LTTKFCRPFHSRKPRKDVDLPDYLKTLDSLDSREWNEKHGCKYWDSYVVETNRQFELKPISNKFFDKKRIQDDGLELEVDVIPTLEFRVEDDPWSEEKAYEGIYDMVDICGDEPSYTPNILCHGHKVYRGVDLGIAADARDQAGDDPRRQLAELRTLHRLVNDNRRYQYTRTEHQWQQRYKKRVNFVNRISQHLHG